MDPREQRDAVMAAMQRCFSAYGTPAFGGARAGFDEQLERLVVFCESLIKAGGCHADTKAQPNCNEVPRAEKK